MDLRISRPLLVALLAGGLALSASPPSLAQSGNRKLDSDSEAADKGKHNAKAGKDSKDAKDKGDRKGGDGSQAAARPQDVRKNDQRERETASQRDGASQRGAQQQEIARARQQQTWNRQAEHQADQRRAQADKRDTKAIDKQVKKQAKSDDKADRRDRRLSQQEQRKLISQQQARVTQYRQYRSSQQAVARRVATLLATQNRTAQSRYVSNYQAELLRQQQGWNNNFNYDNDPYFYSAPIYRYQRSGNDYSVNQYGANLLKQAVNAGYQEGIQAGQADRRDRWRADYRNSYAYQDASYGYDGYYLSRDDYSYYFRQGFQRGYEDGYNSRYQYGRNSGGSNSILATILTSILGLQSY